MLCNFDEFWVYDFETQMDAPVDKVTVETADPLGSAGVPLPDPPEADLRQRPSRRHAQGRRPAGRLLQQAGASRSPGGAVDNPTAQRFILQMLVALFAEDIGLLPQYMVDKLLDDCKTPQDSRDLIGGLFEAMNTREKTDGRSVQGVATSTAACSPNRPASNSDWTNWIFSEPPPRKTGRRSGPKSSARSSSTRWERERHAFGAHFTHPTDIMKIVGPTIVEPWRKQIEEADTLKRLHELWQRMHDFSVLDPACGSGNFLYIAYRELKRLEARLLERMAEKSGRLDPAQMMFGFVTARHFFGIDINPFAVELAKVTMMIARKLAIDELHITEQALPLDNLDENFMAADALIDELGNPAQWPRADVIIGNPPFLGEAPQARTRARLRQRGSPRLSRSAGHGRLLRLLVPQGPRPSSACTPDDPVAGRAGLVGTQNIRNNQSRVGGLDYVVKTGTIIEAVDNQPWSGEANVHVSIANWVKTQDPAFSEKRRLWFKVEPSAGSKKLREQGTGPAAKEYELDMRECLAINSTLSDQTDVSAAKHFDATPIHSVASTARCLATKASCSLWSNGHRYSKKTHRLFF